MNGAGREAFGAEGVGVGPERRVTVHGIDRDHDRFARAHRAAEHVVRRLGGAGHQAAGRIESQRFVEHLSDLAEPRRTRLGGAPSVQRSLRLGAGAILREGIERQQIERPGWR